MDEAKSSPLELRRLWPSDKEAFRDHLVSLDPRSRHLRFGGGMSDEFLVRYAEHCFGKGDLIYGAFIDGKLVGAGELRSNQAIGASRLRSGGHIHAEAAFSVDDGYRRRGVGQAVPAHPARRRQPWRRNDRGSLPARKRRNAEPGEEVQAHFTFEEYSLRADSRAPADGVFAVPGSLGRRARLRGPFLTPIGGRWRGAGKGRLV